MIFAASFVIPAQAGIHLPCQPLLQWREMDPRLRGDDDEFLR
jgi:hypothetical protein